MTVPRLLDVRALNRATLARQLLLRRSAMTAHAAVEHLVGLQAQNVKPPYYALAARLDPFTPADLARLMASREAVRIVTLRSTIHTHTAADCLALRPFVQPARERELKLFRKGLGRVAEVPPAARRLARTLAAPGETPRTTSTRASARHAESTHQTPLGPPSGRTAGLPQHALAGVDLDRLTALARDLVEERPRTPKELREALAGRWPDADPRSLGIAARCLLPLVQVTPRGVWGESGQVALTTSEHWLGRSADTSYDAAALVRRYLAAFGPASVKDMQTWAGLTRLRPAFEKLELLTFRDAHGTELFDLPEAPRPDPRTPAPPRFLPEFDNLLLSHADRTRIIPPEYWGRTWVGNVSHPTFLVDGFLAGVWKLTEGILTVQPFGHLTKTDREAVTREAARMLTVMHPGTPYDIRFGTVIP